MSFWWYFFNSLAAWQVIINYRNKSTGQLSFLVTAMTFGGYLNSRLQTNQVRKLQIVYRLGVAGGPLPVPVANEGLEDSLLKIRIILPMAPVTGRGPHRIYMCLMCLKQFLVKMWTHNFIFDFQICADHSMTSYLCFWTSSKFARKWWSWVRKPMDLRTSARLFTTFVEVDDLPLQLTMQLGMT